LPRIVSTEANSSVIEHMMKNEERKWQ